MQQFDSFAQMQRDAERRVMEMQKRAMAAVEVPDAALPRESSEPPADLSPAEGKEETQQSNSVLSLPELSPEESERALIIMILMLLLREQADERLILALLYILM